MLNEKLWDGAHQSVVYGVLRGIMTHSEIMELKMTTLVVSVKPTNLSKANQLFMGRNRMELRTKPLAP